MNMSAVPAGVAASAAAAARAYLRLVSDGQVSDGEAGVLARCGGTAVALAEAFCGQVLVRRQVEDVIGSAGGEWHALAALPVTSIAGVTGLPAEGAPFVLPVGDYGVDIDADGVGWIRVPRPGAAGRMAVTYVAGLAADWDGVPAPIAQGVAMLAAHLFEQRGETGAPPAAVAALWRPYRRLRLASPLRGGLYGRVGA